VCVHTACGLGIQQEWPANKGEARPSAEQAWCGGNTWWCHLDKAEFLCCHCQVRMATFSQHHVDGLDLALTPLQAMMRTFPDVKDEPLRCRSAFLLYLALACPPLHRIHFCALRMGLTSGAWLQCMVRLLSGLLRVCTLLRRWTCRVGALI
jgi:hypothetical protein